MVEVQYRLIRCACGVWVCDQVNPRLYTKTSLMLGLGETKEEVLQVSEA